MLFINNRGAALKPDGIGQSEDDSGGGPAILTGIRAQTATITTGTGTLTNPIATTVANGTITVTTTSGAFGDSSLDGKTVKLVPYKDAAATATLGAAGDAIAVWKCGPGTTNGVNPKYLPSSCRG